ncbi:hypothetical protein WN51_08489 [Melipona quadrifasciata]|uniref:Uncharacterized protein n=1 Tax=Melipona quadrifasciata TaxID=166423 RepID=A0A0M9A7C8_9HYME|nr:hypothetical protein WN51_08489 [Melipona quadrifasciata]
MNSLEDSFEEFSKNTRDIPDGTVALQKAERWPKIDSESRQKYYSANSLVNQCSFLARRQATDFRDIYRETIEIDYPGNTRSEYHYVKYPIVAGNTDQQPGRSVDANSDSSGPATVVNKETISRWKTLNDVRE